MADVKVVKYNQSENFKDFDMLVFKYKGSSYAIHTNPDGINLNGIGEVPAYIVGDSIYVGHPNNENVRFEGYIVDLGIVESLVRSGNSNNQTDAAGDNATSLLND